MYIFQEMFPVLGSGVKWNGLVAYHVEHWEYNIPGENRTLVHPDYTVQGMCPTRKCIMTRLVLIPFNRLS